MSNLEQLYHSVYCGSRKQEAEVLLPVHSSFQINQLQLEFFFPSLSLLERLLLWCPPFGFCQCGRPMETSRCLDCGVDVGGMYHRALPGFREFWYALIH